MCFGCRILIARAKIYASRIIKHDAARSVAGRVAG